MIKKLYWNDYGLIFPVTDLYTNNIKPYTPPKTHYSVLTIKRNMNTVVLYHFTSELYLFSKIGNTIVQFFLILEAIEYAPQHFQWLFYYHRNSL